MISTCSERIEVIGVRSSVAKRTGFLILTPTLAKKRISAKKHRCSDQSIGRVLQEISFSLNHLDCYHERLQCLRLEPLTTHRTFDSVLTQACCANRRTYTPAWLFDS